MNNITSYNHAASQGKNKATRIKGRGLFVQPEVIPQFPQQTSVVLEAEVMNLSKALNDLPTLWRLLSIYTQQVLELEDKVSVDAAKVEFYDDMADTEELFNTGIVAKTLGTGKTKFLNYLRKHKILMGSGNKRNLPYQQHLDAGRLEAAWVNCVDRKTGKRKITPVPLFTGKGIIWIQQFIKQNGRQGL